MDTDPSEADRLEMHKAEHYSIKSVIKETNDEEKTPNSVTRVRILPKKRVVKPPPKKGKKINQSIDH